jgi:hypothetical protein
VGRILTQGQPVEAKQILQNVKRNPVQLARYDLGRPISLLARKDEIGRKRRKGYHV